jgi:hypothetical protein
VSIEIIRKRERREETIYQLVFDGVADRGRGFAFPCDAEGNVDLSVLQPAARKAYDELTATGAANVFDDSRRCLVTVQHHPPRVHTFTRGWTEEAIGRCQCGRKIGLGRFTNTCECGRDYNGSGSLLAPCEFWGEDTNETVDDILSVDSASVEDLLGGD